jgi:hypothetical protein
VPNTEFILLGKSKVLNQVTTPKSIFKIDSRGINPAEQINVQWHLTTFTAANISGQNRVIVSFAQLSYTKRNLHDLTTVGAPLVALHEKEDPTSLDIDMITIDYFDLE